MEKITEPMEQGSGGKEEYGSGRGVVKLGICRQGKLINGGFLGFVGFGRSGLVVDGCK